jgi:hypothetical protein
MFPMNGRVQNAFDSPLRVLADSVLDVAWFLPEHHPHHQRCSG